MIVIVHVCPACTPKDHTPHFAIKCCNPLEVSTMSVGALNPATAYRAVPASAGLPPKGTTYYLVVVVYYY